MGGVLELDTPLPKRYLENPSIVFIQSAVGVFGYTGLSQADTKSLLYFSFYDSGLPERGHRPDPRQVKEDLLERHRGWHDPMVEQCLDRADIDTVWPIFYLPDLPYWGRDGCVLIGGAAHAVTPATGQGGSQAFEDAQTLALLLKGYLHRTDPPDAIEHTIRGLFDVRHERVYGIKAKGWKMKEPDRPWPLATTLAVYAFFFIMTRVEFILRFLGRADATLDWDAASTVESYMKYERRMS